MAWTIGGKQWENSYAVSCLGLSNGIVFFLRRVQLCGTRGLYRRKDTIVYCVESKPMATLQGSGPAVYRGVYTHFSFPHLFGECLPDGG